MITAIIIAGGVGKRMGQDIPKQFINIEEAHHYLYIGVIPTPSTD